MLQFSSLARGLVFAVVLIVVPVTLVVALLLVWLFRARVRRSMRATSGGSVHREQYQPAPNGPPSRLEIEVLTVTKERRRAARRQSRLVQTRQRARAVALMYAGVTSILPLVLATVLALTVPFAPKHYVIVLSAIFFIGFFLMNATPVVLAPTIVLTKQLLFQILAILALIVVMWVLDRLIGDGSSVVLWLMISGAATAAFLLMSVRRLRAVGPIVFAASLLCFLCASGGVLYAVSLGWNAAGMHFVRDDLAQLSPADAAERYWDEISQMPRPDRNAALAAVMAQPKSLITALHPEAFTTEVRLEMFAWALGGIVAGPVLSFLFVRWLAVHYRTRRASDQMLSVDVLMAVFTLYSLVGLSVGFGWGVGAYAIPAFGAYALCSRFGLQRLQRSAPPVQPRTILFLRVFGFDQRTQRLLQDLGQRWRTRAHTTHRWCRPGQQHDRAARIFRISQRAPHQVFRLGSEGHRAPAGERRRRARSRWIVPHPRLLLL